MILSALAYSPVGSFLSRSADLVDSYLAFACAGVDGDELEALTRNEIHFATALIELAEQITDPTERLHVLRGVPMTARKYAYPRMDRPGSRFSKWT